MNPIYAVALTPDGQYAACGRANQIFVYHVPSGQLVTRLTDPALVEVGLVRRTRAWRISTWCSRWPSVPMATCWPRAAIAK